VRLAHSNLDFVWDDYYRSVGGVDGLLSHLDPNYEPRKCIETTQLSLDSNMNKGTEQNGNISTTGNVNKDQSSDAPDSGDAPNVSPRDLDKSPKEQEVLIDTTQKDDETNDPSSTELLSKASTAVNIAHALLAYAQNEVEAPVRLSEEFMNEHFSVDPDDGHFEICSTCGMGGDVICCESCPMVCHPKCAEMDIIPDGDWHCDTCVEKRKEGIKQPNSQTVGNATTIDGVGKMNLTHYDESTAALTSLLEELKSHRQKTPNFEVGTKIAKVFHGTEYLGEVISVPSKDSEFYRIKYEDNDVEDLTIDELQVLVSALAKKRKADKDEAKAALARQDSEQSEDQRSQPYQHECHKKPRRGRPIKIESEEQSTTTKRKRGRPRKHEHNDTHVDNHLVSEPKRRRGRPPKRQHDMVVADDPILPKRRRGRPSKKKLEEDKSNYEYSSQSSVVADISLKDIPSPGHVDPKFMYYCTTENDTCVTIARALGCDWQDVAYVPENLERFPSLKNKSTRFRKGTLVRVAECNYAVKKAIKLVE